MQQKRSLKRVNEMIFRISKCYQASQNFRFVFIFKKAAKTLKTISACTETADLIL
jgi:hypothetical protein